MDEKVSYALLFTVMWHRVVIVFLLGASSWLFLPGIPENVTGYQEKNVCEIIETAFKIYHIFKNLSLF